MARTTTAEDISAIEERAAILNFYDMVPEYAHSATARMKAFWIFTSR